MKRIMLLLLSACLMMVLTAGVVSAKTLFLSDTVEVSNPDAATWVDAFNTEIRLTAINNQCIELRFATEARTDGVTPPSPQIAFRALVDGILAKPDAPEIVFQPSEPGQFDTVSFNWFVCGLNVGRHTIQVQFSPVNTGHTAFLRSGTLIMEFQSGRFVPLQ